MEQVLATLILALCLSWASAAFNCSLYASTCSETAGYTAYSRCSDTVAANPDGMTCRAYHLGVAAMAGNATEHCPHAAQDATGDCATEILKSFNCSLYASTCSGTTDYTAYSGCSDTVLANPLGMACRTYHLGVAAMAGNAAEHCPHAAQDATGDCATEVLKSFDCSLYASTCSATEGYTAYSGCSETVLANPLGMACRTYHLGVAAMAGNAAEHCPHAAQDATGPCAAEVLSVGIRTSPTSLPTSTTASGAGTTFIKGNLELLVPDCPAFQAHPRGAELLSETLAMLAQVPAKYVSIASVQCGRRLSSEEQSSWPRSLQSKQPVTFSWEISVPVGLASASAVASIMSTAEASYVKTVLDKTMQDLGITDVVADVSSIEMTSDVPLSPSPPSNPLPTLGLNCPVKPSAGIFQTMIPLCQTCAPLRVLEEEKCLYDVTDCQALPPGQICKVKCREPYIALGPPTNGTCAKGNSIIDRMVVWSKPECVCPEPQAQQGYVKTDEVDSLGLSVWGCASGYAGKPVVRCNPTSDCSGVETFLDGCKALVTCAVPLVDNCRYDISACVAVGPGATCELKCKFPLIGGFTVAQCKENNTDPLKELDYYPLSCMLRECPDPSPWPEGYNKTADGHWKCAQGYNGTAINRCELGPTWSVDCGATAKLTGCQKVVNCGMPKVLGIEACTYDMTLCQSTEPGAKCEVHCKSPFVGIKTQASCPAGNVDPFGLEWVRPECQLISCDEPSNIPNGYMRYEQKWMCAQSYTGYAEKVCEVTLSCEAKPALKGCSQLKPCSAEQGDCRYDMYGCVSVQPGATCDVRCKVPFAGTTTSGNCPAGNTDSNGLIWTPPTCVIDTCSDPVVDVPGYVKSGKVWQCAPGWSGTVVKTCSWVEAECRAEPMMSGCVRETACMFPPIPAVDLCQYDLTACVDLLPGKSCTVKCKDPYVGGDSMLDCPGENTNVNQSLQGKLPVCGCGEPVPLPPGYNRTQTAMGEVAFTCSTGFGGEAKKLCRPGPGPTCTVDPVMIGCAVPLACIASIKDEGSGSGAVSGSLHFGPALVDGMVDEADVVKYSVFFADECQNSMGIVLSSRLVRPAEDFETCCRGDAYEAKLGTLRPPVGAAGFLVMVQMRSGQAPVGLFVPFNETAMARVVLTGAAPRSQRIAWTAVAGSALVTQFLTSRIGAR